MKLLKVFMKPFRTFFRPKGMGKLSVLKGSAEKIIVFFRDFRSCMTLGHINIFNFRVRNQNLNSQVLSPMVIYRTSERVRALFTRQFWGVLVNGFFWNFGYQSFITRQFDSQNFESKFAKLWIFSYGLTFWTNFQHWSKIDPFWLHHLLPIGNFAPPAANSQFCCF